MDRIPARSAAAAMLLTLLPICSIDAAELNVLAGGAMRAALQELIPPFEHSSGHSVRIEYGTVAKVAERVSAGDPVDVAVLTKPPLDKLIDNGRIAAGTAVPLARVPIGLAVPAGVSRPDVGSVEAIVKALKEAKYITYGDPGMGDAAGVHVSKEIERLGLAAELKSKTRLISPAPGQSGAQFLSGLFERGETELAIAPISVLMETRGAVIVGLLPPELQSPDLVFFAGTTRTSKQPAEAGTLIDFLHGEQAKAAYRAKGMDPG